MKEAITQCIKSFMEVAKSLIGSRKMTTPQNDLWDSSKASIDILDNIEGVEVRLPFWVNATEVLKNKTKHMLWL